MEVMSMDRITITKGATIQFSMDELKVFVTAFGATSFNDRNDSAQLHYGGKLELSSVEQETLFRKLAGLTDSRVEIIG